MTQKKESQKQFLLVMTITVKNQDVKVVCQLLTESNIVCASWVIAIYTYIKIYVHNPSYTYTVSKLNTQGLHNPALYLYFNIYKIFAFTDKK